MKILHISTSDSGGAGIAALRLHLGLLNCGIDSKFLCLNKTTKEYKNVFQYPKYYPRFYLRYLFKLNIPITNEYRNTNIILKNAKKGATFEKFSFVKTDYKIHNHQLIKEADIIILHWIADFVDLSSFFKKNKKKIIWYLHDLNPVLGGFHLTRDLEANQDKDIYKINEQIYKIKKQIYINQTLTIVGNSEWTTNSAIKSQIFNNRTIYKTIHLGINTEDFQPINKSIAKKALLLEEDNFYILFAATDITRKWKGLDLLMKSFNQLKEKGYTNIKLLTFGKYVADTNDNNKNKIICFDEIKNSKIQRLIYSAADIHIIPSLDESFGQTALESAACGTPVIAFNVGGIPDQIKTGYNGYLIEEKTSDSLSLKIEICIKNKNKLELMGENARIQTVKKFSLDIQVKKFIELFTEIHAN